MIKSEISLPIDAVIADLLATLEQGPFAVLVAAPGAGKTTRVPLALMDAQWRRDGRIIMLAPRRLAARAAARRMAAMLEENTGDTVGYRVRLDTKVSAATRIEVVTEGVFTRMILNDPELSGVAAIIFDEFHERSLEGDLGLALALDATALRPDLRILVMSATMDAARVTRLLSDAPLVASEGRMFPVETIYLPPKAGEPLEDHTASAVMHALENDAGSILVFLPGQAEIRRTIERLAHRVPATTTLMPLYGQLAPEEQDRAIALAEPGKRKVVLATSIAQTSLTIDGIRIVIDSGFSRMPAYEPATGLTTLVTRPSSQAASDQRQGRAGRTQPGTCYRLWSQGQNAARSAFDTPEILAADLSTLALDLASWGVMDPSQMAFLDQPPVAAWSEAVSLLKQLQALDAKGGITAEGRALSRLPVHPRLAHMIHSAQADGMAFAAAKIAMLVTERGLGGDSTNLDDRLHKFENDRGNRAREARSLARRWANMVGGSEMSTVIDSVGTYLAKAYPDRIAQASGRPGRFRLANGRAASLHETDALSRAPFLVVTDITGGATNGIIRAAATLERADIEEAFHGQIVEEQTLKFDPPSRSLRCRQVRRLGEIRLSDIPAPINDAELAARTLAMGIAQIGISALPWSKEQLALRARASYLYAQLGAPWSNLSDAALMGNAEDWLAPYLHNRTALADISTDDLAQALSALLPWSLRVELDSLLPSHFEAPTGSRHRIIYNDGAIPSVEIRVQELFGLDRHPTIASGKVPLLLVLLSPAHRPIQKTQDLPGFWQGSWKDVAKDLKGRYPRHPWPDDPLSAQATFRVKPRGT